MLGGWQRLWVFLALTWTVLVLGGAILMEAQPENYSAIAAFWLVPIGAVYALGWGIGWVARGFRQKP